MPGFRVPDWVTVTLCPAIVSVAVRGFNELLAASVNEAVPDVVPLPLVTVIHDALLTVVQAHPVPVDTPAATEPPVAGAICDVGETV